MTNEEYATRIVLHLKAAGETFVDEDYARHEIKSALDSVEATARSIGWEETKCDQCGKTTMLVQRS